MSAVRLEEVLQRRSGLRVRSADGRLFVALAWRGQLHACDTGLLDTRSNRRRVARFWAEICTSIEDGTFDLERRFPGLEDPAKMVH